MTSPSDANQEILLDGFEKLSEVAYGMRRGSIASIVAIGIGLTATLLSGIATGYLFFRLYNGLSQAKAELKRSQSTLAFAERSFAKVKSTLESGGTTDGDARIRAAISQMVEVEMAFKDISTSIKGASSRLPFEAANDPKENRWYARIASYDPSPYGQSRAFARMDELALQGRCVEVWKTKFRSEVLLTLGGATDEFSAAVAAEKAMEEGLSPSAIAFQNLDNDWKFLKKSTPCGRQ